MATAIRQSTPQLIVSLQDASMIKDIRRAIKLIRGVTKITVKKAEEEIPNETTLKAINEAREGKLVFCSSFEDYLNKVK